MLPDALIATLPSASVPPERRIGSPYGRAAPSAISSRWAVKPIRADASVSAGAEGATRTVFAAKRYSPLTVVSATCWSGIKGQVQAPGAVGGHALGKVFDPFTDRTLIHEGESRCSGPPHCPLS